MANLRRISGRRSPACFGKSGWNSGLNAGRNRWKVPEKGKLKKAKLALPGFLLYDKDNETNRRMAHVLQAIRRYRYESFGNRNGDYAVR
jgi:hypothetical protein